MTIELKMLALSVVLGVVQIAMASHAASVQRGYRWAAGPRDDVPLPLTGVAGRLDRALRNFLETFALFCAIGPERRQTQLDDRMGRAALFLGAGRLSRALCVWSSVNPLFSLERSHDWNHHDPLGPSLRAIPVSLFKFSSGLIVS